MKDKPAKPYWWICKNCGKFKIWVDSQKALYKVLAHEESCKNGDKNGENRVKRIFDVG